MKRKYSKHHLEVVKTSKIATVGLLDECLKRRVEDGREELINEITKALDIEKEMKQIKERNNFEKENAGKEGNKEVCEVCEGVGDEILKCETCSRIYHVNCIRPKLTNASKNKWSCPKCIVNGLCPGDIEAAKHSLDKMERLTLRMNNRRQEECEGSRLNSLNSLGIRKSGRGYTLHSLLNMNNNNNINNNNNKDNNSNNSNVNYSYSNENYGGDYEMGRFPSLETALLSAKRLSRKTLSSLSSLSLSLATTSSIVFPPPLSSRSAGGIDQKATQNSLWCSRCLDDNSVTLCLFCGCQGCMGKHDSRHLLICDGCEDEYHTYCLEPKLDSIPQEAWFCKLCIEANVPNRLSSLSGMQLQRGRGRPIARNKTKSNNNVNVNNSNYFNNNNNQNNLNNAYSQNNSTTDSFFPSKNYDIESCNYWNLIPKDENNKYLIPSLETAIEFIKEKKNFVFTDSEKNILDQLRRWSNLNDLKILQKALVDKNMELIKLTQETSAQISIKITTTTPSQGKQSEEKNNEEKIENNNNKFPQLKMKVSSPEEINLNN